MPHKAQVRRRGVDRAHMDLGDLLSALFQPSGSRPRASRAERILGWVALIGIVLMVGFVWLVVSGF
jgi:hypothetical protein